MCVQISRVSLALVSALMANVPPNAGQIKTAEGKDRANLRFADINEDVRESNSRQERQFAYDVL